MFTGIVRFQGVLRGKRIYPRAARLTFESLSKKLSFQKGGSVAVDGVCLTVCDLRGRKFSADVIEATLRDTTLEKLSVGQRVNLEPALRLGDSLDGHWVTGHVDGVGVIEKMTRLGENLNLQIKVSADIIRRLVIKGSISVDGISFTIQRVGGRTFMVAVTPHTYRVTTLPLKRIGDPVNLEVDLFAKLVQRFLASSRSHPFTEKDFKRQGF